jgi:hypothetical protein
MINIIRYLLDELKQGFDKSIIHSYLCEVSLNSGNKSFAVRLTQVFTVQLLYTGYFK